MGYSQANTKGTMLYLNTKEVAFGKAGKMVRIYFFSKDQRPETECNLPEGYEVLMGKGGNTMFLKKIR